EVRRMKKRNNQRLAVIFIVIGLGIPGILSAQQPSQATEAQSRPNRKAARAEAPPAATQANADLGANMGIDQEAMESTRRDFMTLMQNHPRFWSAVQADPSLLSDQEYVNRDPVLASFFARHPEVARDPDYFVGWNGNFRGPGDQGASTWDSVLHGILPFLVFVIILSALLWVFRHVLENRRWSRMTKIQTDLHTRLLEKFTSNQELFAYMETEAGKRFLESVPVITDPEKSPRLSAPFGRILWSFQAGLILALAGIGLLAIRSQFAAAAGGQALLVLGTLGVTIGAGFIIAATVSYGLSKHLGLFEKLINPKTAKPDLGDLPKSLS
ncbi:MAG: hypothetical protein ACRD19_01915, partial [Terriglobia bacterium]